MAEEPAQLGDGPPIGDEPSQLREEPPVGEMASGEEPPPFGEAATPRRGSVRAAQPIPAAPLAYFHGQDGYGIERAATELAAALGGPDASLETWRTSGDEDPLQGGSLGGNGLGAMLPTAATERRQSRLLDAIEERLATAPLFGGGTFVVVRQPASLLRDKASRDRLIGLIGQVAPGNGLCFCELSDASARGTKATDALRQAVAAAGGVVREFPAPTRERMERWIDERAAELGIRLGPGAARLLTERIGASVREGDVDRRGQTQLANAELEKLALYRPAGDVSKDDVAELVVESVPGSVWALLDAIAARRAGTAAALADSLLTSGTPLPVLVSQFHRRLRELVVVREHLATGTRPSALPRVMGLKPFRAEKLAEQAAVWRLEELEAALEGLLEVDLTSKGIALDRVGGPISDERSALALDVWLAERVAVSRD
jgi:DNA polymerase-3 subunit delta